MLIDTPQVDPNCTEPYYTRTVLHIAECRCNQCQLTPFLLIDPNCTVPYYTRTVLPIEVCRCTQCQLKPLTANEAQLYRTLLRQISFTYGTMQSGHIFRWCVQADQMYSPTNWAQLYRTLLHHISFTYGTIKTYPVQIDPLPNWAHCTEP